MTGAEAAKKISVTAFGPQGWLLRIFNPVRRVLFFSLADNLISYRKGLAVSINKGRITVVSGSRFFSRVRVKNVKEYSFDPSSFPDPEAFAAAVSMAAGELRLKKASIAFAVPKSWTVFSIREFPSTILENIVDAIRYELDRMTPFSADEAVYDFRVLGERSGKITVLLAAAKADLVMPYIDALREKGILVSSVRSQTASVGALPEYLQGEKNFIFVNEAKDISDCALFMNGSLSTVASVKKEESEAEHIDSLLNTLSPLAARLRESGTSGHILLQSENEGPAAESWLGPKTGLTVTRVAELLKRAMPDQAVGPGSFQTVSSLIEDLRPKANSLDLLAKGLRKKEKTPFFVTVLLVLAIVSALVIYIYAPLELEKRRSMEFDKQIAGRKDEVKKVEALKKEIGTLTSDIASIGEFRARRPLSLSMVREITSLLPGKAWLTRLRISETKVELEGYAASATELIPKLEASKYFSGVELAATTFRDQKLKADRFVIKMEIEGVKKAEKAGDRKK